MGFFKLGDSAGFDVLRDLQVIALGQNTSLYLPMFGSDVRIRVADESVAAIVDRQELSETEKSKLKLPAPVKWFGVKKVVLKGKNAGRTQLITENPDGTPWEKPTQLVVVRNLDSRQVDRSGVTEEMRKELQSLSARTAALRVAEDQLYSAVAANGTGDGRYDLPTGLSSTDWCGAFVYWCWKRSSAIRGERNPWGDNNDIALSPQKAITWGIQHPIEATVLRYKGPVMMGWGTKEQNAMKQNTLIEAVPGDNLLPGDLCLLRDETNWKHVDMVFDPGDGETFITIDGNQGIPSLKKVHRNFKERLGGTVFPGMYKHVFVHLNQPA